MCRFANTAAIWSSKLMAINTVTSAKSNPHKMGNQSPDGEFSGGIMRLS
ncbi:MAG TPA: hypothetical protein VN495_02740 [Candidatus Paceibacterota bacterium]|nr:hypothetical protein [Candidatus Paceibacterota bacterium]